MELVDLIEDRVNTLETVVHKTVQYHQALAQQLDDLRKFTPADPAPSQQQETALGHPKLRAYIESLNDTNEYIQNQLHDDLEEHIEYHRRRDQRLCSEIQELRSRVKALEYDSQAAADAAVATITESKYLQALADRDQRFRSLEALVRQLDLAVERLQVDVERQIRLPRKKIEGAKCHGNSDDPTSGDGQWSRLIASRSIQVVATLRQDISHHLRQDVQDPAAALTLTNAAGQPPKLNGNDAAPSTKTIGRRSIDAGDTKGILCGGGSVGISKLGGDSSAASGSEEAKTRSQDDAGCLEVGPTQPWGRSQLMNDASYPAMRGLQYAPTSRTTAAAQHTPEIPARQDPATEPHNAAVSQQTIGRMPAAMLKTRESRAALAPLAISVFSPKMIPLGAHAQAAAQIRGFGAWRRF